MIYLFKLNCANIIVHLYSEGEHCRVYYVSILFGHVKQLLEQLYGGFTGFFIRINHGKTFELDYIHVRERFKEP